MAKVAKLSRDDVALIEREHKRLFFRGTPEKFYLDSGFWEYIKHVKTKDEHDSRAPFKPFPIHKLYLQVLFLHILNLDMLMIPKSRQIMLTWAMAAFTDWFAKTAEGQQIIIQSKKEDDADEVVSLGKQSPGVGRIDCIEQHLPPHLRDPHIISGHGNQVGQLTFSPKSRHETGVKVMWSGSRILALPQGADQPRGRTGTMYCADEAAMLDDFADTWETVAPAMVGEPGSTKMIAWSSVYGGSQFNDYVLESDEVLVPGVPAPPPENTGIPQMRGVYDMLPGGRLPRGMRSWVTPSGIPVLEIHYTADPDKDPQTERGKAWLDMASSRFKGGVRGPRWQREMEINYEASGGDLVFPHLSDPNTPVFIPAISAKEVRQRKMILRAGYDYGTRNPAAFIVWAEDIDTGDEYAIWELYEPCLDLDEHVAKIKACPYMASGKISDIYCDWSLRNKTQQTQAGLKSILELFAERGLYMVPGRKGADLTLVQLLTTSWGADGEKAATWASGERSGRRYYITDACPNTQREFRGAKWDAHTSQSTALRNNNPEKLMNKNNHAIDASAYLHDARPEGQAARRATSGFSLADYREETARKARQERYREAYLGIG